MSKSSASRRLGPELTLVTGIGKDDEVLVIGLTSATDDDGAPTLVIGDGLLDDAQASAIDAALAAVGAKGSAGELTRIPAPESLAVASVLAVGLGAPAKLDDAEHIRRQAGVAARSLDGVSAAVTTLSTVDLAAAAEGFFLGAYRFDEFRSTPPEKTSVGAIHLLVADAGKERRAELDRSVAIATAVATARDFVNTPPSHLFPDEFAIRSKALASAVGIKVEILDEAALAKNGYGGIIGVGKGSSRPPRLVRLSHIAGKKAKTVALVGKGVTFDTGGISIKPAAGMDHMTSDMGGAAAVIATTILAATLNMNVNVIATVPMAENMPSSTAQRPGDVLTQYGGKTVEVLNTDAEGRLILADAIVRACEDDPDYLIDTATLTGAQMVALGTRTPGVMGTDAFRDRVAEVSRAVGESGWAMPFPEELRADLDSRVADLANITNHRWGGMMSAGIFLREFVAEGVEWAHVDIAGPAFNTGGPWGYTGKGGTGVPVRTIFAVLEEIAAEDKPGR